MVSYLKNILDVLKRSLWFIPVVMTLCGLILSIGLNYLDWFFWTNETPYLGGVWGVNLEGIRSLFTSVSAAIITAMTTILSITLLIFTVLAGQYGAHVLRIFKLRTFSKFIIGWFSGVYIYMIYHVYAVTINNGNDYIPQLSITFGVIFTVSTIFLLIIYIHFLVRQIQVGTVVSETSTELYKWIESLDTWHFNEQEDTLPTINAPNQTFKISSYGYIQNINKEKLKKIAAQQGFTIKVLHRPGDFVMSGETILCVYTSKTVDESLIKKMISCYIVGEKRIPVEDLEFNLEILIEMTLRALSPGMNDILIANQCIDYIGESIALLVKKKFPKEYLHSEEGKLLLVTKEFSFAGYMNAVLNSIRQYAILHCSVSIRIMDILIKVIKINECDSYRSTIQRHFMAIYESTVEKHKHPFDQESINQRYQKFISS